MKKLIGLLLCAGAFLLTGDTLGKAVGPETPPGVEVTLAVDAGSDIMPVLTAAETFLFAGIDLPIGKVNCEAVELRPDPGISSPVIYLPRSRGHFRQGYNYSFTGQYRKSPVRCGPIKA